MEFLSPTHNFFVFLKFDQQKCVFIIFISFFDEWSNFRNRILTTQKPELVIRNCPWNCMLNYFSILQNVFEGLSRECYATLINFKNPLDSFMQPNLQDLIYNLSARHERYECTTSQTRATQKWRKRYTNDTSAIRVLHERQKCDKSEKILILITTRVKTYFHIPIFTIWQVKDY